MSAMRYSIAIPLEQGLRQIFISCHQERATLDSIAIPLEQGLRQAVKLSFPYRRILSLFH